MTTKRKNKTKQAPKIINPLRNVFIYLAIATILFEIPVFLLWLITHRWIFLIINVLFFVLSLISILIASILTPKIKLERHYRSRSATARIKRKIVRSKR